jgi:phage terminase large subunit-like protein
MKLANPASWITEEYLARQAANPELATFEVLQMHGCVWAEGIGTWITADRWAVCFLPVEIPKDAVLAVGVDAAHTRDTTACTITWTSPEGRHLQRTRVWSCIEGKPHHVFVPGGRLDNNLVVDYIREELMRDYDVRLVVFDERYFTEQAQRLAEDDDLMVVEMQQAQGLMREAWSLFYDSINMGETPSLAHDGDPIYAAHVRNCAARKRDDGSWHVSKAAAERPIDAVAAGAMSLFGAVNLIEEPREVTLAFT